tara:strand:- start:35 stop:277 length:243 start_codon:yes stop_codon:yes gene_type:complete
MPNRGPIQEKWWKTGFAEGKVEGIITGTKRTRVAIVLGTAIIGAIFGIGIGIFFEVESETLVAYAGIGCMCGSVGSSWLV